MNNKKGREKLHVGKKSIKILRWFQAAGLIIGFWSRLRGAFSYFAKCLRKFKHKSYVKIDVPCYESSFLWSSLNIDDGEPISLYVNLVNWKVDRYRKMWLLNSRYCFVLPFVVDTKQFCY